MTERKKFYILLICSLILVVAIIINNIFRESFSMDFGAYLERRFYYERVVSKKGLSLHRAMYWREER